MGIIRCIRDTIHNRTTFVSSSVSSRLMHFESNMSFLNNQKSHIFVRLADIEAEGLPGFPLVCKSPSSSCIGCIKFGSKLDKDIILDT